MYHLQITKSMHNKEINGRRIRVITNNDYENLDDVDSTLKDYLSKSLDDLDFDNNECFFVKKENQNEKTDPEGDITANYYIRLEQFN